MRSWLSSLRIADRDLIGTVALRVLAVAESLERSADTADSGCWSEIGIGMSLSAATFDLPA